jgi:rod shape-determining protein MreB
MFLSKLIGYMSNDVAIDLGTANTLVHVRGRGIVLNEPSVVAVERTSRKVLAVGKDAKEMLGRTPQAIEAVRPMRDGVIADFEMTEELLRNLIVKVRKHRHLVHPRIVVSVPSGITEVEKRAVRDSAERAGAREVFLVAEPIAAAIGVGLPVDQPLGNMVIDIGGGTTEIAVMTLNGIVHDTSLRVAGDKMDEAIQQFVKGARGLLIGDRTAERIKIEIGSAFELDEELELEIKGRHLIGGIPKTTKVTSVEIRGALEPPIKAIKEGLYQSLEQTPPELASDIVDRGIVMTGGGSLLRGLDKKLREETNLNVRVAEDALLCVVLGCGKILDNLEAYEQVLMKGNA